MGTTLGVSSDELCSQIVGAGMKAQAWGSCAPLPPASCALIKSPKPLSPKGNQAGIRGSPCSDPHCHSMSQGFPGLCGQWRRRDVAKATG